VIVVEHDPLILRAADHLIDMGPGAGIAGGQVLFQGEPTQLATADTPTARWLRGNDRTMNESADVQTAGCICAEHVPITSTLTSSACRWGCWQECAEFLAVGRAACSSIHWDACWHPRSTPLPSPGTSRTWRARRFAGSPHTNRAGRPVARWRAQPTLLSGTG
jgi:hypothetical protein